MSTHARTHARTRKYRATLVWLTLALIGCTTAEVDVASTAAAVSTADPSPISGPSCGPFETLCGPRCVATGSDPRHCGACGYACSRFGACVRGRCRDDVDPPDPLAPDPTLPTATTRCHADRAACGEVCVDLLRDADNCGACGATCPGRCSLGACTTAGGV